MRHLLLGVDTGGTYTDAVALSAESGEVVASAKALTTRADLAVGIEAAIAGLQGIDPQAVAMVGLSTTLATNAIVEGHGGRACLLLIGYDPVLIERFGFRRDLVVDDPVHISGGHDLYGRPAQPLDEAAVRRVAAERAGRVDAFAVSDYLGVRNPEHELRVKEILTQLTGLPVTCGHELSDELDSIRRATTVALNARLIPMLQELLQAVRRALAQRGIHAPLMLVKGDGSLMGADLAMEHPVETILSGPAASVLGARHLSGRDDLLVVDMGGTTTDLAILRRGRPRASTRGAWVGGWRTLVRAVDTRSVGLGGDSLVALDANQELQIGPERVVPLSLAAADDPRLRAGLASLLDGQRRRPGVPQFFSLVGRCLPEDLTVTESELLALLGEGTCSLEEIARRVSWAQVYLSYPNRLEAGGFVQRIGFTPTDALHVLGRYAAWDGEAARLGATLLGRRLGLTAEALAEAVCEQVVDRLATEIVAQVAADETGDGNLVEGKGAAFFLQRAFHPQQGSALSAGLRLRLPLAAVGAPVDAYFPQVANRLGAELVIPPQAGVANAVGAASGSVLQSVEVLIEPQYSVVGIGAYTVHTSEERREFANLQAALSYAQGAGQRLAEEAARRAGAEEVAVEEVRDDHTGSLADSGDSLYLGTRLHFTAAGRPRMEAEEWEPESSSARKPADGCLGD